MLTMPTLLLVCCFGAYSLETQILELDQQDTILCQSNSENRNVIIDCIENLDSLGRIQFSLITGYQLSDINWQDEYDPQNLSLIEAIKASDFTKNKPLQLLTEQNKLVTVFNNPWKEPHSISLCVSDLSAAKLKKQGGLSCFHFPYASNTQFNTALTDDEKSVVIKGEIIDKQYTMSPEYNYHYRYEVEFDVLRSRFNTLKYLPVTKTPTCFQLSSFSIKSNAESLYDKIAWAHPNVFIRNKEVNGKHYYQLILASYSEYHATETLFDLQEIFGSYNHGIKVTCPSVVQG